ncbi:hypothetical protein T440DRAFT_67471 [Plenodomus tracheiphilus IPT5]|uniref:RING-type domain-containing protein n=1 Tax=Plenodomus tracheiphilus IPT5 TaxID=1408161 RepID=A0A6A7ANW6_9PLEO|nr:hypothetical protein T440DRAFT_67471 [Plenodomus tracheiphilus IPT5]
MSLVAMTLYIDLTLNIEHCAICSIELEEGSGEAGLVYVLKNCRCVICGLCVQFPSVVPFLPCQHADHLDFGSQRPLRLYNLNCAICLDLCSSTRVALICGHVYCRTCILQWATSNSCKNDAIVDCPVCRNGGTKLWRLLASDQVVMPAQRGVEIVSSGDSP